jgi:hypothetical protein
MGRPRHRIRSSRRSIRHAWCRPGRPGSNRWVRGNPNGLVELTCAAAGAAASADATARAPSQVLPIIEILPRLAPLVWTGGVTGG